MLISAHPDDVEYFAGGLVSEFTAAGGNASYLILTNGDGGFVNIINKRARPRSSY